ncbi:unnamed protein product [Rhizophagus irregularis]|nr:unnamed protein product [Rhizophagus irregularis]
MKIISISAIFGRAEFGNSSSLRHSGFRFNGSGFFFKKKTLNSVSFSFFDYQCVEVLKNKTALDMKKTD